MLTIFDAMDSKDEPQKVENNVHPPDQPKNCYRIILTDEDENDLTIEESDEEKQVNSPEPVNEEPGCSHYKVFMGNNQDVEVKKYDKGKKKIRRGKRKRVSEADNIYDVENDVTVVKIKEKEYENADGEQVNGRKKKRSSFNCHHCSYISSWKTNLEKHMMAQHTGERPFKCPYCEYASVHQFQLEKHFNNRHPGGILTCTQCTYSTDLVDAFFKHTLGSHPTEKPHKCPECGRRSITLSALELHILDKHKLRRQHKCPHCNYSTVLSENLKNHVEALHKCSDCDFRSDSLREVRRHKKIEHRTSTKCDKCDHIAKGPQYLKRHIAAKHSLMPPPQETTENNHIPVSPPKFRKKFHILNPPPPPTLNIEVSEQPLQEESENYLQKNSTKAKKKFSIFNQSNSTSSLDETSVTTLTSSSF
ncbi:RE1-silencing transcription factor B isoform X3 [Halyomorpha halys]|uniref:RE1-silencing transcription factor B isoform X3 n=1 Tax=Halyomorpha halys TaxID=286706 RepID=UPI0006D517B1|nr:RE1-silencing transcription factor isoform X3 [Halyomorpha halys]